MRNLVMLVLTIWLSNSTLFVPILLKSIVAMIWLRRYTFCTNRHRYLDDLVIQALKQYTFCIIIWLHKFLKSTLFVQMCRLDLL